MYLEIGCSDSQYPAEVNELATRFHRLTLERCSSNPRTGHSADCKPSRRNRCRHCMRKRAEHSSKFRASTKSNNSQVSSSSNSSCSCSVIAHLPPAVHCSRQEKSYRRHISTIRFTMRISPVWATRSHLAHQTVQLNQT